VLVGARAATKSRAKCELRLCSANDVVLTIGVKSACVDVGKATPADHGSWVVEHSLCHKLRSGVSP